MAKKDPSLSLEYILQKQQSEKLSGLSSTVKSQIGNMPTGSDISSENNILSELKKINTSLNVNLNKNIIKMTKAIENSTNTLAGFIKGSRKQVPPQSKNDLSQQDIEDKDYKSKELRLLEEIRDGLMVKKKADDKNALPLLLAALGAALGTLLGLVQGYINFLRKLLPGNLLNAFKGKFEGLGKSLEQLGTKLKNRIGMAFNKISEMFSESKIGKFLSSSFEKIKKFLRFEKEITIFSQIGKAIKEFIAPFQKAFIVITELISGPVNGIIGTFKTMASSLKIFSGLIKTASSLVKYIFEPILIVLAVIDTIKGITSGFKKDGLVGAIKGGLKGLFDATLGGFLDLIKDISSWILDKLGFDKASEFLDSFSFKDLYSKFIDMFFAPMKWLQDILTKISIGPLSIFGKKFGPWKPFAALAAPEQSSTVETPTVTETPMKTSEPIMAPAIEVKPENVVTPPATAAEVIYEKSAENEEGAMYPFATPATNIVNAPTTITKSTQNNLMKVNVRNSDTSIKDYYRSRFST